MSNSDIWPGGSKNSARLRDTFGNQDRDNAYKDVKNYDGRAGSGVFSGNQEGSYDPSKRNTSFRNRSWGSISNKLE